MYIQWNPDFSNLQGKRKLVREIGSSRNRRWQQITLNWPGIVWLWVSVQISTKLRPFYCRSWPLFTNKTYCLVMKLLDVWRVELDALQRQSFPFWVPMRKAHVLLKWKTKLLTVGCWRRSSTMLSLFQGDNKIYRCLATTGSEKQLHKGTFVL